MDEQTIAVFCHRFFWCETKKPEVNISEDLKEFDAKLRAAKQVQRGNDPRRNSQGNSPSALHSGMEFIGGVLAGALLGWFFDRLFDTSPFGLIVFMLLGFASGLLRAVRSAQKAALDADMHGNDSVPDADSEN